MPRRRSLTSARRPPRPRSWVGRPRRGISAAYLARLAAAGTLTAEPGRIFARRTRWRIVDAGRVVQASARLDVVARSSGPPDSVQAAYAGLAYAIGLGTVLYPGRDNRPVRRRLEQIAKGKSPPTAAGRAIGSAATAGDDAAATAGDDAAGAGRDNAARTAGDSAAVNAATQAAVQAVIRAVTGAAVAAAASSAMGVF